MPVIFSIFYLPFSLSQTYFISQIHTFKKNDAHLTIYWCNLEDTALLYAEQVSQNSSVITCRSFGHQTTQHEIQDQ